MRAFCFTMILLMGIAACKSHREDAGQNSPLSPYFQLAPLVSKSSSLSVVLRNGAEFSDAADERIFSFSPEIKGSWVKVSPTEFVFSPESYLASGKTYQLTVANKSIENVPTEAKAITLAFSVIEQDMELVIVALRTDDSQTTPSLLVEGEVRTADAASAEEISQAVSFSGTVAKPQWRMESNTHFRFELPGIARGEEPFELVAKIDGKSLGINKIETRTVRIPSVKEFELLDIRTTNGESPAVSIFFTDPIAQNQELIGLITLEGETSPRFVVDGNEIRVYLSEKPVGNKSLHLSPGIKNKAGYPLTQAQERVVTFENTRPELKLVGKGTILPSSKGLYMPFEAIGLKSVQVKVIRIHEANLPVFFQTNDWNGDNETMRSGKVVYAGKVDLKKDMISLDQWNRHHLDLSKLFEAEKGAMYRVEIGMRPADAYQSCLEASVDEENFSLEKDWSIYDYDGFSPYSSHYSWYYPRGYSWKERDNPCHPSYFTNEKSIVTNLLSTDIGLIAKIGSDNVLSVVSTQLSNAAPISADINVLDFQLQSIGTGKTDGSGFLTMQPDRRPFLIIAQVGGQKSYLKLSDGLALSTSNFDVSGQQVKKGLKGFIYGERDVWRPGDPIYLSFILEDKAETLPASYPVSFELRDPNGNLKDEQVSTSGVSGLYRFQTQTEKEAITGNWTATVHVGNSTFSKRVKIETIRPNRLKIDLDFGQDTFYKSDGGIQGNLTANWLTGVKAPQLQAQVNMDFRYASLAFPGYPQFAFEVPADPIIADPVAVVDQRTDQNGMLNLKLDIPEEIKAPGKLRLLLETKVYEPGGGFSINYKTLDYIPYESLAGVKVPEGDEFGFLSREGKHRFDLASITPKGAPLDRKLKVEAFKLNWRWWWDQQYDSEASYISSGEKSPLLQREVQTTSGKASLQLDGRDFDWGRHFILVTDPVSGHQAGKVFYMGWSEGEKSGLGASFLSVTTTKDSYETNEEIEVTLPSSISGKALVTVENGSSVLEQFWIDTHKGSSKFSFTATPDMAPTIYLSVTLIQPHGNADNDLPIRSYGILPLKVFNPQTQLEPVIQLANELSPGKEVKIGISEKSGKAMAYTVAVVDEGLLDITGFRTPDPWNHFYQKESLGVKTWDLYDHVLGAFGGKLERLLAIGGSDLLDLEAGNKRDNRFEPVVRYFGPFELRAGGKEEHTFIMPQYIGSAKVMVVAAKAGSYGSTDRAVPVIQPVMVLGTLPRVIGPDEEFRLPVSVLRLKDAFSQASVQVKAEGIVSVSGEDKKNVALKGETTTEFFTLTSGSTVGEGKVSITATSGGETATYATVIESRMPNPRVSEVQVKRLAKGEKFDQEVVPFGISGTHEAQLTLSRLPAFNLEKHLQYLIQFPHGCLEQVVSTAFPQLFLDGLTTLSLDQKVNIERNVKAAIQKLQQYQTHEGGLSYWPGNSEVSQWASIYATHFMLEARKKGYAIPSELYQRAISYQKRQSSAWKRSTVAYNDDLVQAYRLYLLAKSGDADQSAMNRMRNEKELSQQSIERLATAYALLGRKEVARDVLKTASSQAYKPYAYWYTYGSEERDLAMRLETYILLDDGTKAFETLQTLAGKMNSAYTLNTHAAAYALVSISQFAASHRQSDTIKATVTVDGKSSFWESKTTLQSNSLVMTDKPARLQVVNEGEGDIYLIVTQSGVPLPGQERASSNDLEIAVRYQDPSGKAINVESLPIGSQIQALVSVRNTSAGTVRNIALSHLIPAGWEISNERLQDDGSEQTASDHLDIRDDRIYSYFDLASGKSRTLTLNLTAAYAGKFYLPAISAEAMYETQKHARTVGKWISVVPAE